MSGTELLSDPKLDADVIGLFLQIPLIETGAGFWERAGRLRARILGRGLKARGADALIAQACLDHDAPLITRDHDFRHFAFFGLRLVV